MENSLQSKGGTLAASDLRRLNGKLVLVRSSLDKGNPPSALRGWLEVHANGLGRTQVRIAVELPQMFSTPARHRTVTLDDAGVRRLLASESNGTFQFTIDEPLA